MAFRNKQSVVNIENIEAMEATLDNLSDGSGINRHNVLVSLDADETTRCQSPALNRNHQLLRL